MSTKVTEVHPNKIFTGAVAIENRISITAQLHSDVKLASNGLLSLVIDAEQAKTLHDSLGKWLSTKDKE
jgi:hypothetical protein